MNSNVNRRISAQAGCVVLFGDVNVDVLMAIPRYPEAGGDAMASQVTLRAGGSVANTAVVLAKLGVATRLISRTGDDFLADLATRPLVELGVDLRAVGRDPEVSTGLIFIPVTGDGERTMFSYRGANIQVQPEEIRPELLTVTQSTALNTVDGAQILHISGYNFLESPQRESAWRAVELARQAGIALSLDVGVEPARRAGEDLLRLLPGLGLLSTGMAEAGPLFSRLLPSPEKQPRFSAEEAARAALERGVQVAAVKLGRKGCLLVEGDQSVRLPAFPVQAVDTTGAGDAFCAGLLFARLRGLSLPATAILANALGALAATVWGGGEALPGRAEAAAFLRSQAERSPWMDEALAALGAQ